MVSNKGVIAQRENKLYYEFVNTIEFVIDQLVPQERNNHRAKILQLSGIFAVILLSLFMQFGLRIAETSGGTVLGYAANIPASEVVDLTNKKRAELGLSQLTISPDLVAAAQAKGEHMLEHDYWAHVAPDGTEPWKFFCDHNYCNYRYAGENLARDFTNANAAIEAWMASPSHKENMLNDKYTEIGIAVVEGDLAGTDTTLIVQLFGTRLSSAPNVPVNQPVAGNSSQSEPTIAPTPTTAPTAQPSPTVTPTEPPETQTPVIAQVTPSPNSVLSTPFPSEGGQVLVSPFNIRKTISFSVGALLMIVLIIDAVVVRQKHIRRNVGRTFAHFSYLLMILVVVLILSAGKIL